MTSNYIQGIKVIFLGCVLLLCGFILRERSIAIPYFGDEYDYVSRGVFLDLILQKDFGSVKWSTYDSYGQEKLPSYYYRGVLYLFRTPMPTILTPTPSWGKDSWCKQSGYTRENCLFFTDTWMWKDEHFEGGNSLNNLSSEVQQKLLPIKIARIGALVVAYAALLIFFLILARMWGFWVGFIGLLMLSFHPVFQETLLKAMGDGLFVLFLLLSIYFSMLWFSLHKKFTSIGLATAAFIGITSGLAMSSKLIGFFGNIYFLGLLIQSNIRDKRVMLITTSIVVFFTLGIFFALHPFLWSHPIHNGLFMFRHRAIETLAHMNYYPQYVLPTIWDRFVVLLSLGAYSTAHAIVGGLIGVFVDLSVFLAGLMTVIYTSIHGKEKQKIFSRFFLFWSFATFCLMIFYMGLRWERYYMPFLLCVVGIQSIGSVSLIKYLVGHVKKIT